jgi:hypothetical protein
LRRPRNGIPVFGEHLHTWIHLDVVGRLTPSKDGNYEEIHNTLTLGHLYLNTPYKLRQNTNPQFDIGLELLSDVTVCAVCSATNTIAT